MAFGGLETFSGRIQFFIRLFNVYPQAPVLRGYIIHFRFVNRTFFQKAIKVHSRKGGQNSVHESVLSNHVLI